MSAINKLSKEVFNIATFSKDVLKTNITNSALKGELALNQEQLRQLLLLVESSVDQATQKGLVLFEKNAKIVLGSDGKGQVTNNATFPATARKK